MLASGFTESCYDGLPFFSTDHPQTNTDGDESTVSNMQAGAEDAWYLLDTSRAVRPLIWQERDSYQFQSLASHDDSHVFLNDEYIYGVRARVNAGFGLWQLAFGSKEALTAENYAAARALMKNFRSENGRILGINPTTLVVPARAGRRRPADREHGAG